MIRLNHVSIRNWRRIKSTELDLPQTGTVVVIGRTDKSVSSGSGKTSLGEAISKAVFGVPEIRAGNASFLNRGNTYVKVEGTLNDRPLVVELGYKCKELGGSGEALRFSLGSQTIQRPNFEDTRAELRAALGIDQLLATWTVFIDGVRLKFNDLTQTDQIKLLMQVLRQPPWPAYHSRALKSYNVDREELISAEATLSAAKERLEWANEALATAKEEADVALSDLTETRKIHARDSVAHVKREAAAEKKWQSARAAKNAALKLLNQALERRAPEEQHEAIDALKIAADSAENKAEAIRSNISRLTRRGEECPTCGQKWPDSDHRKKETEKLKIELKAAVAASEGATIKLEDEIRKVRKKFDEQISQERKKYQAEYDKKADEEDAADAELQEVQQAAPAVPDEGPYLAKRSVCTARERDLKQAAAAHERAASETAEIQRRTFLGKYWVDGLGPTGIPNMVLAAAVEPLNQTAALVSQALSGGALKMEFSATTELASGEERQKIAVLVDNPLGASKLGDFSKGETGLTNLIISETLAIMGHMPRRCGWRWLDEPINNQDRKAAYSYLKKQTNLHGLATFIVDHHPEALTVADHILMTEKDERGITTYRWK